jgi:DNA (cytosine-5)-methyltransferase 1
MGCDGAEVESTDEYYAEEVHAFNSFLAGLSELGYGFFYRVLDAQYFGLAQRRKRVFVVGYLGDWRPAAAVFLERESLSWNSPPRREKREDVAISPTLRAGGNSTGGDRPPGTDVDTADSLIVASTGNVPHCLNAGGMGRIDYESETLITHALRGEGFDASEDGTGRGTPLVPVPIQSIQSVRERRQNGIGIGQAGDAMFTLTGRDRHAVAFSCKDHGADAGELAPTLRAMGHDGSHANAGGQVAVAFHENQRGELSENITAGSLKVGGGKPGQGYPAIKSGSSVRRLTPRECERLQGFPDDYTRIPYRKGWAADGPRYKALGNSMAVPCMAWTGSRIQQVEAILSSTKGGVNA